MLLLAAMKLELALGFAALLAISGCSASRPQQAEAPKAPTVSTTKLMAAEITEASETSDAPKVSKPQHSVDSDAVDTNADKELPVRKSERHHGGGFSGYK
jgi:hypothetical protein